MRKRLSRRKSSLSWYLSQVLRIVGEIDILIFALLCPFCEVRSSNRVVTFLTLFSSPHFQNRCHEIFFCSLPLPTHVFLCIDTHASLLSLVNQSLCLIDCKFALS